MKQSEVLKESKRIIKYQDYWYKKEQELQAFCKHKNVIKTPRCGGDSPTRYWYECKCTDCNKFWTISQ